MRSLLSGRRGDVWRFTLRMSALSEKYKFRTPLSIPLDAPILDPSEFE